MLTINALCAKILAVFTKGDFDMNSELKEKIQNLQQRLDELKEERKSLIQKFNDGEKLTRKESKRNIWLAKEIKSVESQIQALNSICTYDSVKEDLDRLANDTSLTSDQKKVIVARLTTLLLEMNDVLATDIKDKLNIENISELESKKQELEEELNDLQKEKKFAERRGNSTKDIDKDIEDTEKSLEDIKSYEEKMFSEDEIKNDMKLMAASKTSKAKKREIAEKYSSKIDAYIDPLIAEYLEQNDDDLEEDVDDDLDNSDNKKSLKEKTKDKLKTMGAFLNRHKKKIAAIAGSAVLVVGIIMVAKTLDKNIETNDKKDNDPTPSTSIEQTYENPNKETIDSLVNKGYDEYSATLMVENFSKKTIDSLLETPYIEAITKYATVKDFNLDYINDYENAFITYSIAPEKAVDYVNRSYEISKTNFYEDASINEIVEIVMALDKQELFTKNNANLAQSFNTAFNQITEKYLFGELEDADINKLNALKYFAKEGSDMDDFLTNYSILVQEILNNPTKDEPRNKMYDFISIFAHTLNGFKNEVELTDSEALNENAIVKDYYDWYMAYCSFIAPLYPTFNNPDVEVHGYIDENGVEVFESSDERYMKFLELQELMISGMQSPEIQAMCEQSLTLN